MSGILNYQTALITGASGGIGSEIAKTLAANGAAVALHYNRNKPHHALDLIQQYDVNFCAVQADLDDENSHFALLDEAEEQITKPNILINCAACQDVAALAEMSLSQFNQMIKTNLTSVFALSREFASRITLMQSKTASIINISSIEARRPAPGHGHYATSKAALEMLTKAMALEYGPKGLRVNAIAPGLVQRDGIKEAWPDGVKRWNQTCPLGRMADTSDIANAVVFLASDAAKFITGTVLTVDGGMSATPGW